MSTRRTLLSAAVLALLLPAVGSAAGSPGRLAQVSLIDRDSGAVLPATWHRGEWWVAGAPGARYAIAIRSRASERLLAVTSVDGVNVITGDTASWAQTGYVFTPGQRYEVTGWRKSDTQVAAFEFASAGQSYAARTGRAAQVGVIGVALFRERQPDPPPPPLWRDRSVGSALPEPAAPMPPAAARSADAAAAGAEGRLSAESAPAARPQAKLGTGHGARETSVVRHTEFQRRADTPDEIVRIRYDSRENLIAMGVLPARPAPAPSPDPFPDAPQARYVPDPPVWR